jgi:hypothetical protein
LLSFALALAPLPRSASSAPQWARLFEDGALRSAEQEQALETLLQHLPGHAADTVVKGAPAFSPCALARPSSCAC